MPARYLCLILILASGLRAQLCLNLPTAAVAPGESSVSMDFSLDSSADAPLPASLQWTLQYPQSAIRSLTVDDGPAVTASGKTVMCNANADGYNCLAVGSNTKTISKGVIAKITVVLAPEAASATIQVLNPFAASPEGYFIPITTRVGTITTANVSPDRRLRPPLRRVVALQCRSTQ